MSEISEKLLRALESDDAGELGIIIKKRKQEDFKALQTFLSLDPSIKNEHRAKAIYALGRWGDPAPVKAIGSIISDLDEASRITAINTLGRISTEDSLDVVIKLVDDPSPNVRKFVARALARINTTEAHEKLKEIASKDKVEYVRVLASKYIASKQKQT